VRCGEAEHHRLPSFERQRKPLAAGEEAIPGSYTESSAVGCAAGEAAPTQARQPFAFRRREARAFRWRMAS